MKLGNTMTGLFRHLNVGLLVLFSAGVAKNTAAEEYYWQFQGTGGYTADSAYKVCENYFKWNIDYYGSPDDILSNFRMVDAFADSPTVGPGKIYHCKYDLQRPWQFYPNQTGQANRYGDGCAFGKVFFEELGACLDPVSSCPTEGNPVELVTGSKIQTFEDLSTAHYPIKRYYREKAHRKDWYFDFEESARHIPTEEDDFVIWSKAGKEIYLQKESDACWRRMDGKCFEVELLPEGLTIQEGDTVKTFDIKARLISSVTGQNTIQFDYSVPDQLNIETLSGVVTVSFADGRVVGVQFGALEVTYQYDALNDSLTSVTDVDGSVETYSYEDAGAGRLRLTAIAKNSEPYAFWEYDAASRVIESRHVGEAEKFTFQYLEDEVVVTSPLNKQTRYFFEQVNYQKQVTHVLGEASQNCAAASQFKSYYDDGSLQTQTDWVGNVTFYERDSLGRVTQKAEGLNWPGTPLYGISVDTALLQTTASTKITTTCWHATHNKPERVIEPNQVTRYEYYDNGQLKLQQVEPRSTANDTCPL